MCILVVLERGVASDAIATWEASVQKRSKPVRSTHRGVSTESWELHFRDHSLLFTGKRYSIRKHDQELPVQGHTEAL